MNRIQVIADARYFETRAEMLRRKWLVQRLRREEQIATANRPGAPIRNLRGD